MHWLPNKCLSTFPGGHSVSAPGQLDQLLDFVAHAFRDDERSRLTARAIAATDCRTVFLFQASVEKMMTKATWRSRMTIEGPTRVPQRMQLRATVWATTLLPSRLSAWFTLTPSEPCNMSLAPQAAQPSWASKWPVDSAGVHHRFHLDV